MTVYSGWQLETYVGSDLNSVTGSGINFTKLAGITKVTDEYSNQLSPQKNVGDRTVFTYTEGTISLSGTIEKFYFGTGSYSLTRGAGESGSLTSFYLGIYPGGKVSGQEYICYSGVKIGDHRTQSFPGSRLKSEIWDFVATRQFTGSLP